MREATLILDRIRCAACLWLIEQSLRRAAGREARRRQLRHAARAGRLGSARHELSPIVDALRAVGYDAYPYDPRRGDELRARRERALALWRLFVAAFGAMQVMMYALPAYVDDGADRSRRRPPR